MSTNWLEIIATDPALVPTAEREAAVVALFTRFVPAAEDLTAETSDEIVFHDSGANLQAIRCPACGAQCALTWWQDEMARASEARFVALGVVMPCCAAPSSLNDLGYDWPCGFARWRVSATSPGRMRLTDSELEAIAATLGHAVREIWVHR